MSAGDLLLDVCSGTKDQLTLCAPFAKVGVIAQIIEATPETALIELFTRWRPEEVNAGVSDTAVLERLQDRSGSVFLCDRLHAKYVRADQRALIGSANLTAAALGWRENSNLELLVEVPSEAPALREIEDILRAESVPATEEIAAEIDRVAALLPPVPRVPTSVESEPAEVTESVWYPRLREPRDLYTAYAESPERLSRASGLAATVDLAVLEIQPSLDRGAFEELVATRLMQAPVVRAIDSFLGESQRFGAVRDFLGELLGLDRGEASYAWQTLMRWMLYFMSERYARSVPSYSEILTRRDETPELT